ncbi:MAG: hypothetical protein KF798_05515 [Candidatus Paracaedibacteraceae bacterium]|nr:hypothetical protein [Candidatus Paracaedibacteraceae bacterium]
MKKILSAVAAIALIGGGGYFYATQKFATEAGYLKENLEQGTIIKADKVEITPWRFKIDINGLSVDFSGFLPKEIQGFPESVNRTLIIKDERPYKLCYSPLSKKITISSNVKNSRFMIDHFGQKDSFSFANDKGEMIVDLASTPHLKDITFGQFVRQYVVGWKSSASAFDLRVEGATDPLLSADHMEGGVTTQPSELGTKATLFSKTQGATADAAALFDTIIKLLPEGVPGVKEAIGQIKPSALLKGLKRDKTVTLSVDTDFNAIIDSIITAFSLEDDAARSAELQLLLTKIKGVSFFIDGEDQMLGARLHTVIDASVPPTIATGHLKAKLDVSGQSSKEFQDKLPDIVAETLRQNLSALPESSQQDAEKMVRKTKDMLTKHAPDLVSMGKIGVNIAVDGKAVQLEGNVLFDLYCDLYGAKLTVDSNEGNIKAVLRVTNADQLFADFEAYATKLINDPEMIDMVSPETKAQLPLYVNLAKTTLKSMAKESKDSKGNTILEIEQVMPLAVAASFIGGAAPATASE